jgi:hypothetical protein
LSDARLTDIRKNYFEKKDLKEEKDKQEYLGKLARMKKYPKKNPDAIDMLVDYTVWNDVKFYHVGHTMFH